MEKNRGEENDLNSKVFLSLSFALFFLRSSGIMSYGVQRWFPFFSYAYASWGITLEFVMPWYPLVGI